MRNPEYAVEPSETRASRLKTVRYVAKPTNMAATMKGLRVAGSVMSGMAQRAFGKVE